MCWREEEIFGVTGPCHFTLLLDFLGFSRYTRLSSFFFGTIKCLGLRPSIYCLLFWENKTLFYQNIRVCIVVMKLIEVSSVCI